jgi:hypothetical protein
MSHNISIFLPCSLADLQKGEVQEILKELGWVFLGPGTYQGYDNGEGNSQTVDMRIAMPAEQAGRYGEDLQDTDAGTVQKALADRNTQVNTKGYKIVGVNSVKTGTTRPVLDPMTRQPKRDPKTGKPVTQEIKAGDMEVILDNFQAAKVQQKIQQAVTGAKGLEKVKQAIGIMQAQGAAKDAASIYGPIRSKVVESIKTGKAGGPTRLTYGQR